MEFRETKGIYQQIADQISDRILSGEWKDHDRIPSIRETAASIGVNPNTVTRSFKDLMSRDIIYNKRGLGYFVSESASDKIKRLKKEQFMKNELPRLIKAMEQLGLSWEDLEDMYHNSGLEQGVHHA